MSSFDPDLPWRHALALAEQAIGVSDPNPRVGCVLVSPDGSRLIGQGHTQRVGGPHAEVMALRDARERGERVRDAVAYVTLEPCAHHGRTPPCCDALAAAGLARVDVAAIDPNPLVAGRGIAQLRAAGVDVRSAPAEIAAATHELNIGFISRMARGRPWVRMLWATSARAHEGFLQDRGLWERRAGAVLAGDGGTDEGAARDVIASLAAQGINEINVEGRGRFSHDLLRARYVDELLVYVESGWGREDIAVAASADGTVDAQLSFVSSTRLGRCTRFLARRHGRWWNTIPAPSQNLPVATGG